MMARRSPTRSLALASVALLLLGLVAACSSATEKAPASGSSGDSGAGAAGAAAEAAGSGGTARDEIAASAGAAAVNGGAGNASSGGVASEGGSAGADGTPELSPDPAYGSSIESFEPGDSAGFNQDKLPDIVLGPPQGEGSGEGSFDVVSLGAGGEIVLGFGELEIVDGPGADLLVFENAFWPNDDKTMVFAELGEVSVSEDGETWHAFACDSVGDGQGNFPGCAGVTPTLAYDAIKLSPLDPEKTGGDAFDLAAVGLTRARFVKIRDLETQPAGGNTTGFDLDAVAAIHAQ